MLGVFPEGDEVDAIAAPAAVNAGERFVVTVTTAGNGCDRVGDVGVILGDGDATLMVYDFTRANRPDVVCTMIFKLLEHQVPLTFHRPGEAVIRVWGRRHGPDAPSPGKPVVIERRIEVRGGAPAAPGLRETTWRVEEVRGRRLADASRTRLRIDRDGRVSGNTGCNNFTGTATIHGANLTFSPLATTRRACEPMLMNQERGILDALRSVRSFSLAGDRRLSLLGADGKSLLGLARAK